MESLEVLHCKSCNAPLPLADALTVKCPSCGTENAVPADYRKLHGARIADAAARDRAEHVLRSLDRPPSLATRVLAKTFDQNMFAFIVLFGVPVALGSVLFAMRADVWVAHRFHYASADDVPFAFTLLFMLAMLFVLVFVPRALGVYSNRRVADRTRLLVALAAKPPTVAGAASQCRMCGAPLAVEPDKILAVCSYCQAENAVHLETTLVTHAHDVAHRIGKEVSEAAKYDRTERAETRKKLVHELVRYFVRTVLLGGAFALACHEDAHRQPTTWSFIGIGVSVLLFFWFLIRSMMHVDEDAHERRAGNDLPSWVGIVGPIVVLFLLVKFGGC